MLDYHVKKRIRNNRMRRKAWQNTARRKEDKAIIQMLRSRVGIFIPANIGWLIASVSNTFVPTPTFTFSGINPLHFGLTDKPGFVPVLPVGRPLIVQPSYLHITDELLIECQQIRKNVRDRL